MFYDVEFGGVSGEGDAWTNTMKEDNYKPKGLLDTDTKNPAVLSFAYLMSNEDFRNDFNDRLLKMSEGTFEKKRHLIGSQNLRAYIPLFMSSSLQDTQKQARLKKRFMEDMLLQIA